MYFKEAVRNDFPEGYIRDFKEMIAAKERQGSHELTIYEIGFGKGIGVGEEEVELEFVEILDLLKQAFDEYFKENLKN